MDIEITQQQILNFFDTILKIQSQQDINTLKQQLSSSLSSLIQKDPQVEQIANDFLDSLNPISLPQPIKTEKKEYISNISQPPQKLFKDKEVEVEPPKQEKETQEYLISIPKKTLENIQKHNKNKLEKNNSYYENSIKKYQLNTQNISKNFHFQKEPFFDLETQFLICNLLGIDLLKQNIKTILLDIWEPILQDNQKYSKLDLQKLKNLLQEIKNINNNKNNNNQKLDCREDSQRDINLDQLLKNSLFSFLYLSTRKRLKQQQNNFNSFLKQFDLLLQDNEGNQQYQNLFNKLKQDTSIQYALNLAIQANLKDVKIIDIPNYLVFQIMNPKQKKLLLDKNSILKIQGFSSNYKLLALTCFNMETQSFEFYQRKEFKTKKYIFNDNTLERKDCVSGYVINPIILFYEKQ